MTTSERPRAVVQRVDLSANHVGPVAARTSEAALIYGYSSAARSRLETRPCVCGGEVTADPERPALGVAAHQFTSRHKAWQTSTWD